MTEKKGKPKEAAKPKKEAPKKDPKKKPPSAQKTKKTKPAKEKTGESQKPKKGEPRRTPGKEKPKTTSKKTEQTPEKPEKEKTPTKKEEKPSKEAEEPAEETKEPKKKKKPKIKKEKPVAKIKNLPKKAEKPKPAKKIPRFVRQEKCIRKKLKDVWRKPKGIDSKQIEGKRGKGALPKIGYKKPKKTAYTTPEGLKPVLIQQMTDIENINPKTEAAIISRRFGRRKRNMIIEAANKAKITILNPRKGEVPQ